MDSLVVVATVNGTTYSVLTGAGNYDSDTAGSFSVDFSGLAVNEKVDTSITEITINVFKQNEINFSSAIPLGETTLNLSNNYNSKNSVTIIIEDPSQTSPSTP